MRKNQVWRASMVVVVAGAVLGLGGAGPRAFGVWEPQPVGEGGRHWGVSATARGEYDDNIDTTPSNPTAAWKEIFEPGLQLNLPGDQTFFGLRYGYQATVYDNRPGNQVDQAHSADLILSHTFTPRLSADLQEKLRYGVEPELVEIQDGVPLVTRRRGDYLYNDLEGSARYNLTSRWTGSLQGGWKLWHYDDAAAQIDDRNEYSGTMGLGYSLDPRTTVGVNYRYQRIDYQASTNSLKNSDSHLGYLSLVRRFNPLLSGQLNAGAEYREFDDGTSQTAPNMSANLAYAYAPGCVATVGGSYNISTTEAAGYRSTDSLVAFAQLTHRLTTKFHLGASVAYTYSTFEQPAPGSGLSGNATEQTLTAGATAGYDFTKWLSGDAGYTYDRVNSDIEGRGYDRNRVWLGLRLVY